MKKLILTALIAFVATIAHADSLSLGDSLKKIPALRPGVAYSVCDQKWNYLMTLDIAKWKALTLEVGYAGAAENTADKLVGVLSFDIFNAKKFGITYPIADLIDLRLGIYGGVGHIQLGDAPTMRGGNETDYGVSLTAISLKF